MSRYRMDDGIVVDTDQATSVWKEDHRWDGNNYVSLATGSQWDHETLYRSRRGRFYVESTSQWQGTSPRAEWVSPHDAAAWLTLNEHDIPEELAGMADEINE